MVVSVIVLIDDCAKHRCERRESQLHVEKPVIVVGRPLTAMHRLGSANFISIAGV